MSECFSKYNSFNNSGVYTQFVVIPDCSGFIVCLWTQVFCWLFKVSSFKTFHIASVIIYTGTCDAKLQ